MTKQEFDNQKFHKGMNITVGCKTLTLIGVDFLEGILEMKDTGGIVHKEKYYLCKIEAEPKQQAE